MLQDLVLGSHRAVIPSPVAFALGALLVGLTPDAAAAAERTTTD